MDSFWLDWLALFLVCSIACVSPGPDFVIAVRNSVVHGRFAGIFTALGIAAGIAVHVAYTLFGIAAVIAQSIVVFNVIKYAGAVYLIYVGFKALRSKGFSDSSFDKEGTGLANAPVSARAAFTSGFITNALNPKAALFFLALFSQFIGPETPFAVQTLYGFTCAVIAASWFSIVAFVLTTPAVRTKFLKASQWVDRACGAVFIALGIKLALTRAPV